MSVYLVDSNFFIQAHRATYPLDVATGFWALVKRLADDDSIISIDKVKDELYDKNDDSRLLGVVLKTTPIFQHNIQKSLYKVPANPLIYFYRILLIINEIR